MSVDLPAPFSPSKASRRPRRTRSETPSSARTPGNDFVMPSHSRMSRWDQPSAHLGLHRNNREQRVRPRRRLISGASAQPANEPSRRRLLFRGRRAELYFSTSALSSAESALNSCRPGKAFTSSSPQAITHRVAEDGSDPQRDDFLFRAIDGEPDIVPFPRDHPTVAAYKKIGDAEVRMTWRIWI